MMNLDIRPIKRRRLSLFGLEFDALTTEAAHWAVRSRAPRAPFTYVVTPNVDHVVRLAHAPRAVRSGLRGSMAVHQRQPRAATACAHARRRHTDCAGLGSRRRAGMRSRLAA